MMFVKSPSTYAPERAYILGVMLRDFLGQPFELMTEENLSSTRITMSGIPDAELVLDDSLFSTPIEDWLRPASLPNRPLQIWRLPSELAETSPHTSADIPVIFGKPLLNGEYYRETNRRTEIGVDVFGSAFFMLSRYEEVVTGAGDAYDRFPAQASLAYQERFLERPIINEYLEILWTAMVRRWSNLHRSSRRSRVLLSHDIDEPTAAAYRPWRPVLRNALGDAINRRSPGLALKRVAVRAAPKKVRLEIDPFNTLGWIMDVGDKNNCRSAFYFFGESGSGRFDAEYTVELPWVRALLRQVHERGHEIGLHTSFTTFRDPLQTQKEYARLRRVAEAERIGQEQWGGRQHYLRWCAPITWQNWHDAGLDYDSTVGFADHVGFRCGVCYPYRTFNLLSRTELDLLERPLIAMEITLWDYMGLTFDASLERLNKLAAVCKIFGGDMTLLWHNSLLATVSQKRHYEAVIHEIAQ